MAYTAPTTLKIVFDRCCYLVPENDEQKWMKQKKSQRARSILKVNGGGAGNDNSCVVVVLNSSSGMPLKGERNKAKKSNHNQMNAHTFTLAKRICIKIQRVCSLLWLSFSLLYLIRFSTRAPFSFRHLCDRGVYSFCFYARYNILCVLRVETRKSCNTSTRFNQQPKRRAKTDGIRQSLCDFQQSF